MSLVRDVIDVVVKTAEKHGIGRVATVNLTIGTGRDVVPELFDGLFVRLAEGTVAEGAELSVVSTPYMARCTSCGALYHIDVFDRSTWCCPVCGKRGYRVVSGMEFRIDSIVAASDGVVSGSAEEVA